MSSCAAAAVERGMMPAWVHPAMADRLVAEEVAAVATAVSGKESAAA